MKRQLLLLALFLPALAACGDDDDTTCTASSDCAIGEGCFTDGICRTIPSSCAFAADCPSDFQCQMSMCVSTCTMDADCGTGQVCQSDGVCGTSCGTAGTIGSCSAGEICSTDGTCVTECNNGDGTTGCLSTGMLCQTSPTSASFNQCDMPQNVSGDCPNATMWSGSASANGPIITTATVSGSLGSSANCSGTRQAFAGEVFSRDPFPTGSFNSMGIRFIDTAGTESFVFSDGVGTPSHPTATRQGTTDLYQITFTLCLSPAQMMQSLAIFVMDSAGDNSNAFCFSAL